MNSQLVWVGTIEGLVLKKTVDLLLTMPHDFPLQRETTRRLALEPRIGLDPQCYDLSYQNVGI